MLSFISSIEQLFKAGKKPGPAFAAKKAVKKNNTILHLVFWALAYLFWIFIFRNSTLVLTHAITIQFCYLIFIAANYYFNTGYTIPQLLNKKKYLAFGLCLLAGIAATAALRIPVSILVNIYILNF